MTTCEREDDSVALNTYVRGGSHVHTHAHVFTLPNQASCTHSADACYTQGSLQATELKIYQVPLSHFLHSTSHSESTLTLL